MGFCEAIKNPFKVDMDANNDRQPVCMVKHKQIAMHLERMDKMKEVGAKGLAKMRYIRN